MCYKIGWETNCKPWGGEWHRYTQMTKEPPPGYVESVITRFTPLVEKLFLKFTTASDFFGHPPVKVPDNQYKETECEHPGG